MSNDVSSGIPIGARPAARVLVVSDDDRLLLLQGRSIGSDPWWVSPGGGLLPGESFEEAALRELLEETGFRAPIGPCVWTRRHRFEWYGKPHDQDERFFVARVGRAVEPRPPNADGYIVGYRWWTHAEIAASDDDFSPRRLATFLPPILAGEYPATPFDAGV